MPTILSTSQQTTLLQSTNSFKYRLIILLLLDAGLRVSELVQLKISDFDLLQNQLETGTEKRHRTIPLTPRLIQAFSQYWQSLGEGNNDRYLFPAGPNSKTKHLGRKQVWKIINRLSDGKINPTILRNTFAAKIVSEKDLSVAKELLGNTSIQSTERFIEVTPSEKATVIQNLEQKGFLESLFERFFPARQLHIVPTEIGITNFHIGRKEEMQKLLDCGQKKINLLITGEQGIGKSHLLDNYNHGKIIRIGDLSTTKRMIAGLLLHLFENDKDAIAQTIYEKGLNKNELETLVYRETIKRMTELLIQITEKHEYTLLVDDVTRIPPLGVNALEKLKNHFHIICAARQIPIKKASFLTNFERIELKSLSRTESIELINRLSKPLLDRIEDYETFKNHIFENTNGNPLFMIEMIERYAKEPEISLEVIRDYRHTAALKEFDFSLVLIVTLSSLMVLRYVSGELGDDSGALRLFGGIFLMFALFARNIFRAGKRKFV